MIVVQYECKPFNISLINCSALVYTSSEMYMTVLLE